MIYILLNRSKHDILPKASEVLYSYLKQENYPFWTSFFVKAKDVVNDQYNLTCFVNRLDENNRYFILRTGCFPFIKYHCSKLKPNEFLDDNAVEIQNKFFNLIKFSNFG